MARLDITSPNRISSSQTGDHRKDTVDKDAVKKSLLEAAGTATSRAGEVFVSGGPETLYFFDPTDPSNGGTVTVYTDPLVRVEMFVSPDKAVNIVRYLTERAPLARPEYIELPETVDQVVADDGQLAREAELARLIAEQVEDAGPPFTEES